MSLPSFAVPGFGDLGRPLPAAADGCVSQPDRTGFFYRVFFLFGIHLIYGRLPSFTEFFLFVCFTLKWVTPMSPTLLSRSQLRRLPGFEFQGQPTRLPSFTEFLRLVIT